MVRRIAIGLLLLLVITVSVFLPGCGTSLPNGAVAQVGSKLISEKQLNDMLAAYTAAGKAPDKNKQPDAYKLFKQKCTGYLVTMEVLYQEGPEFGVTVTQVDIDAGVNQIKRMFLGDDAKFNDAVKKLGLTMVTLEQAVAQNLWLERMKEAVTANLTVKEADVQAYYQKHQSEYVLAETRKVRHILISPFLDAQGNPMTGTPTQTDWDAAESEAAKVRSDLMNGANFVTEVEKYSDDPSSKTSGGELGEIGRGQTAPAFEQAVFKLKKGEISEPVRTPSGYSIIQVEDITPAQQLSYDSAKEEIRSKLLDQKVTDTWNNWLTDTMKKLGVVYATGYAPPNAVTAPPPTSTTLNVQPGTTTAGQSGTTSGSQSGTGATTGGTAAATTSTTGE